MFKTHLKLPLITPFVDYQVSAYNKLDSGNSKVNFTLGSKTKKALKLNNPLGLFHNSLGTYEILV